MNNFQFITELSQLQSLCKHLLHYDIITIDTEFMRNKTYYPKLSLIQLATKDFAAVIDVLAIEDISLIKEILLCPTILKVFHAARQDLEVLWHHLKIIPQNIFDTQIAAAFIGLGSQVGLEVLAKEFLNQEIDKSLQFSNWLERPLSPRQLQYALNDASLLFSLYYEILIDLNKNGRLQWVQEDCEALISNNKIFPVVEDIFLKMALQFKDESPANICYEIIKWREENAQCLNLPRGHVIKDEAVIILCYRQFNDIEKLKKISGISKKLSNKRLTALLQVIHNAAPNLPANIKQVVENRKASILMKNQAYLEFKRLLPEIASKFNIPPEVIATSAELLQLAHSNIRNRVMSSWRYQIFGHLIEKWHHNAASTSMMEANNA